MKWDYERFGSWLRRARVERLPVISQERLAERVGVTQAKISRWELEKPGTDAPTLDECMRLADVFDEDFIELATMCGRWNEELERKVLVSLAGPGEASGAVAKKRLHVIDVLGLTAHPAYAEAA